MEHVDVLSRGRCEVMDLGRQSSVIGSIRDIRGNVWNDREQSRAGSSMLYKFVGVFVEAY